MPFAESALCCEYAVNANVAATKAVRQDRSKIRMLLPRRMGCATHLAAKTGTDLFFPRKRGRTEKGTDLFFAENKSVPNSWCDSGATPMKTQASRRLSHWSE